MKKIKKIKIKINGKLKLVDSNVTLSKLIKNCIGDLRERQNRLFRILFMPIEPGEVHFGSMATRFDFF